MNIVQTMQIVTKVEKIVKAAEASPAFKELLAVEPEIEKAFAELAVIAKEIDVPKLLADVGAVISVAKGAL